MGEPFTGDLHLGIIPTIAPFMLAPLLDAVRQQMPRLTLHLHEVQSQTAIEQLEDSTLDMVLLALPFAVENLHVQAIHNEPLYLVCHSDDTLAQQTYSLDDLPLDRLLLLEEGHCLREHALSACALGDRASTASGLTASSLPTLMQLVRAQLGFTLLPEMAVTSGFLMANPQLVARPLIQPPTRTLALLTRKSSTQMAEFSRLAQLLQQIVTTAA